MRSTFLPQGLILVPLYHALPEQVPLRFPSYYSLCTGAFGAWPGGVEFNAPFGKGDVTASLSPFLRHRYPTGTVAAWKKMLGIKRGCKGVD